MKIFIYIFLFFLTMPALAQELTQTITPNEAHQLSKNGEIILIDIRRPDEWQKTGIGEFATPLDMRDSDFLARLRDISTQQGIEKIALICARGGRSNWLAKKLRADGFDNVLDVPEGMLGYSKDTGWINQRLPIRKVN